MKKIYGIFRGFPGLGRVSAGIALLTEFEKKGCQVAAISYYQGVTALRNQNIPILLDYEIEDRDITSIGINPITEFSSRIAERIIEDQPDAIIMDGEPLLQSVLGDVYPSKKIISLLNPSDLYNESLPKFKINFYHKNYLSCGNAIVHGIGIKKETVLMNGCNVHYVPTILRDEILTISKNKNETNRIIGVLGGGSVNSSDSFIISTINMGTKIASIAKIMPQYNFNVYCNDDYVREQIEIRIDKVDNLQIVSNYMAPKDMYKNVRFAIVRAGRNVASELLYLNIPGLLIATSGDYRSKEQEKNIAMILKAGNTLFDKFTFGDKDKDVVEKINMMINNSSATNVFHPGNKAAAKIIENVLERI